MNKQTAEMLRWYKKYHEPISRRELARLAEDIYKSGQEPISKGNLLIWLAALRLILEVRRLRREK